MEKKDLLLYLGIFISGFLMAIISRFWFLLNNPDKVKKIDDKIHYVYEFLYMVFNAILGGVVGLGVYILIIYFELINSTPLLVFISSMAGSVSSEMFTIMQNKMLKITNKIDKATDKALDDKVDKMI